MAEADLPLWDDDPFVQAALRSLPVPDHHPDFWDQLAGRLDDAGDGHEHPAPTVRRPSARSVGAAGPQPSHPPRVAPLRAEPIEPPDPLVAPPVPTPAPTPMPVPMVRPLVRHQIHVPAPDLDDDLPPQRPADTVAALAAQGRQARAEGAGPARPRPAARREQPDPDPDRDLAVVPQALRRRGNAVLAAMTVAAAVVVVVAGATLVRQRADGGGTEQLADASSVSDATTPPVDGVAGAQDPAAVAVLAWVAALEEGDAEAAWEALGDASQRHFGDQAAFEDELASLADDYGAWAGVTPEQVLVMPLSADGDGTISIVTLDGTVREGGAEVERTDAFPVRLVDGEAEIEPFADDGAIDFVSPAPGELVAADDVVVVDVPTDIDVPVIKIGGSGPVRCGTGAGSTLEPASSMTQRCTFAPGGTEPEGERVVTVAFVSDDGASVTARSMRYEAA